MPMSPALRRKLAILGSTYARALTNAAQRAGRDVGAMQPALSSIAQQPLAKLKPGLSSFVRERGALQPTPQQQGVQQLLHQTPWATDEHTGLRGGSEYAVQRYNQLLEGSGRAHAQPGVDQAIQRNFGPAQPQMKEPSQVRPLPQGAYRMPGGFTAPVGHNPFELMDETGRGNTRIGPAPMPQQSRPIVHTPTSTAATAVLRKTGAAPGLPALARVGIPLAVGGGILASKPGLRANARALAEGGSTKERDVSGELPEPAIGQANAIRDALVAHGLDPSSVRMGIDAPPGSGKTTLARALAQQAGMKHYGLDWEPGNWWKSTVGLGRNVEKMPRAPHAGEVLEHYMLGRTYDPELFDAMVHIHRDPEVLKQQLQHRGHGAYIGDLMDLQKSLGVADLGFDTLGGEMIDLGNGVQMKLRPREGWGDALDQRLMQAGVDPTGLSRHEKLLSLQAGTRTTGAGWTPYVKSPFSGGELAAIGASVPLGVMAAKALARRPR